MRGRSRHIPIAALLAALAAGCADPTLSPALARSPGGPTRDVTPAGAAAFDGTYTEDFFIGEYHHTGQATVTGVSFTASHAFSNGFGSSGSWVVSGTIVPDAANSSHGTLLGSGTRTDACCGSISFSLTGGDVSLLADGSAQLNYSAIHPRFGGFGGSPRRPPSRDTQAPMITYMLTGTLGANDWYVSDVGVTWTTTGGPSGVSSCTSPPVSVDGTAITFTCVATAGNGKTASLTTAPAKRDATKPVVTYTDNLTNYTVDQFVSITCISNDNLSGIASSTCDNITGDGYTFALGRNAFSASAVDNAGNVSLTASTSFTMRVTQASLCTLVKRWTSNPAVAHSLCVKLEHGDYDPFRDELSAQSGKKISEANAAILLRLVNAL